MVRRRDRSKLVIAVAVKIAAAFVVYYEVPYVIGQAGEVSVYAYKGLYYERALQAYNTNPIGGGTSCKNPVLIVCRLKSFCHFVCLISWCQNAHLSTYNDIMSSFSPALSLKIS